MKKIYLGVLALCVSGSVMSQEVVKTKLVNKPATVKPASNGGVEKAVLWSNDFSTASDWTRTALSGTSNWVIGTTAPAGTYPIDPIESTSAANGFALFDSDLYCSAGDDAVVKNAVPIDLTGQPHVTLEFESYYRAFQGRTEVGFSTDNVNWTYIEVNTSVEANDASANPEIISVPTSLIANSATAYICFRYVGACDYAWMVDDVKIFNTEEYDLKKNFDQYSFTGYRYSRIPLAQVSEATFEVGVANNGYKKLSNIDYNVTVTGAAAQVLNANFDTLQIGEIDTLRVNFTPAGLGTYNFTQALTLNETDANPANHNVLKTYSFEVNDYIYAVDLGTDIVNFPSAATMFPELTVPHNELGNAFDIYQTAVLKGIDFQLGTGTAVGTELYGKIYKFNPEATTMAEYWIETGMETEMMMVDANTPLNETITLKFTETANLTPDTYLISVVDHAKTAVFKGSGSTTAAQPFCVVTTAGVSSWTRTSLIPVIRMNFSPSLSVASVNELEGVNVFPNPSEGIVNVSNDLSVENTIVVTDISGKVVASKVASVATTIDLSKVGTGIYLVEVSNTNGKKVERVVIK